MGQLLGVRESPPPGQPEQTFEAAPGSPPPQSQPHPQGALAVIMRHTGKRKLSSLTADIIACCSLGRLKCCAATSLLEPGGLAIMQIKLYFMGKATVLQCCGEIMGTLVRLPLCMWFKSQAIAPKVCLLFSAPSSASFILTRLCADHAPSDSPSGVYAQARSMGLPIGVAGAGFPTQSVPWPSNPQPDLAGAQTAHVPPQTAPHYSQPPAPVGELCCRVLPCMDARDVLCYRLQVFSPRQGACKNSGMGKAIVLADTRASDILWYTRPCSGRER